MLIPISYNEVKTIPATGGDVTFTLSNFRNEYARAIGSSAPVYRNVRRFVLDRSITVAVTDGGPAIKVVDLARLASVTLCRNVQRRGETTMLDNVGLDALRIREYLRGDGLLPRRAYSPAANADVAANSSGSTVTTSFTVRDIIYLDKPSARAEKGKAWALSAFDAGELMIRAISGSAAFGDSHVSVTSHTVTLSAECYEGDSVDAGEDFVTREVVGKTGDTGNVTAFEIPGGIIDELVWFTPKVANNGGHAYSYLTGVDGTKYGLMAEFNQQTGTTLLERAWRNGLDPALRDSTSVFGASAVAVPLVFIPRNASSDFEHILARPGTIKLDLTTSTTLDAPHKFLVTYRRPNNQAEHSVAGAKVGIVTGTIAPDFHSDVPVTAEKARLVRHELKPHA